MKDKTFIEITNKDIYEKLNKNTEITHEILAQAKLTNGRVTTLEKTSTGMWIRNHPIKFTLCIVSLSSLFISDIREPLVDVLFKLI